MLVIVVVASCALLRELGPLFSFHCITNLVIAPLNGQEEVLGISRIAKRLGCSADSIKRRFPQECMLITKQAREFRKRRREKYELHLYEEVRKAVFTLHAQGVYPSFASVAKVLSQPAFMRRSDAIQAFHAARRELGLEP